MVEFLDIELLFSLAIFTFDHLRKLQSELVKSLSRLVLILTSMKYLLTIVMDLYVVQRWKPLRLPFHIMDSCLNRTVCNSIQLCSY